MTVLVKMPAENFDSYLASSIHEYAEENITSGRWPLEAAQARSKAEFENLLPQGFSTPDNYFFEIMNSKRELVLGYLWFAIKESFGDRSAFIYDIKVKDVYRRQGHAKRAFFALESIALELNLTSIGLHVFSHNENAKALYESLGYFVTGTNMRKNIDIQTSIDPN